MTGIVYCLENPAMPDLVKIGITQDIEQRIRSLDNTSVPLPFVCFVAVEVTTLTRPNSCSMMSLAITGSGATVSSSRSALSA